MTVQSISVFEIFLLKCQRGSLEEKSYSTQEMMGLGYFACFLFLQLQCSGLISLTVTATRARHRNKRSLCCCCSVCVVLSCIVFEVMR